MLEPAESLCNWLEQGPKNQGDLDPDVIAEVLKCLLHRGDLLLIFSCVLCYVIDFGLRFKWYITYFKIQQPGLLIAYYLHRSLYDPSMSTTCSI